MYHKKIQRVKSNSYQDSIKPKTIDHNHWDMWLKYNQGFTTKEIAKVHNTYVSEVVHIINQIVEKLKNDKPPMDDDFRTPQEAEAFRERIRLNIELAKMTGLPVVTIMSEA